MFDNSIVEYKMTRKFLITYSLNLAISRFLIEVNKRLDGIIIEQIEGSSEVVKFQGSLSSPFVESSMWSPNEAYWKVINEAVEKYLPWKAEMLSHNNTGCIFYFMKSEMQIEE